MMPQRAGQGLPRGLSGCGREFSKPSDHFGFLDRAGCHSELPSVGIKGQG